MSGAIDIAAAVKNQFANDTTLKGYVKSFETSRHEDDLVKAGTFPFVNVKVTRKKSGPAGAQSTKTHRRGTFTVVVTFAVRAKTYDLALEGSTTVNGVWDLCDDIESSIESDFSFSDTVRAVPVYPDTATDVISYDRGGFWIGRGAMTFDVVQDKNIG